MNSKYLVRAKLEYDWLGAHPSKVPIIIGPFTINQSPNINLDARNQGYDPSIDNDLPKKERDYPVSNLYIDCVIQVSEKQSPFIVADVVLSYLEILLRLFQSGGVYIRQHKVRQFEDGKKCEQFISTLGLAVATRHPRSKPALCDGKTGYDLDELRLILKFPVEISSGSGYDLSDAKLVDLKDFFGRYWETIWGKPRPLDIAINRFSSSYEKRTLADRLVDLMIAMETLLGSQTEVSYKIALRFSCLIYPRGEARAKGFKAVKEVYDKRSAILHGESLKKPLNEVDVANFEANVRMLIIKVLELCKMGTLPLSTSLKRKDWEESLDKLIFFEGITGVS